MASKPHKASFVLFASIFYLGWFQEKKKSGFFLEVAYPRYEAFMNYCTPHLLFVCISQDAPVSSSAFQRRCMLRLQIRNRDRKSYWPEGWTSSREENQNPFGLQVSKSSPCMGAPAVLLIDYVNNNPFYFPRILLFEDDLLRIDERSWFFFL